MDSVHVGERAFSGGGAPPELIHGGKPVKSAGRALNILELPARADRPLSQNAIRASLGLPKNSASLLLHTLLARGYLEATSPAGPFRLGARVLELAGGYSRGATLSRQFSVVARRVVDSCQETVQLAILDGLDVVYLAKEDGTRPVRLVSNVGARRLAHATALGKVLLASLPRDELCARLGAGPLQTMTERTISTPERLYAELDLVRSRGYAIDDEEAVEGLMCFAAPILDASERVVAAMSASIPKARVAAGDVNHIAALIQEAARELSQRLGYIGPIERHLHVGPGCGTKP